MTNTTTTTTIGTGDLVRVLRGSEKGYRFNVETVDGNVITDALGTQYKRGNLALEEKGLPEIEPEAEAEAEAEAEVEVVEPTRNLPRVSRGRRPATTETDGLPGCKCGCGLTVLKRNRLFRQGHDQRYRGQQLRVLRMTGDRELAEAIAVELVRHWPDAYGFSDLMEQAKGLQEA